MSSCCHYRRGRWRGSECSTWAAWIQQWIDAKLFIEWILFQRGKKNCPWTEDVSALCFYLVCCHLQYKHDQCLWGQSSSLRGKKYAHTFPLGPQFSSTVIKMLHFPPHKRQRSATFYFSSGSINQLPLEILSSNFQNRWGVFSGGSVKTDRGSHILISWMIIDVYHSFVFVFVC